MKRWLAGICVLLLMLGAAFAEETEIPDGIEYVDEIIFEVTYLDGTMTGETILPPVDTEPSEKPEQATYREVSPGVPMAQPGLARDLPPASERYCDSQEFGIRNGSRDLKRVAVTVDDCYEIDKVQAVFDLCREYSIRVTFFPLGDQLKTKDSELWRAIAASDCEIGSHTMHHTKMTDMSRSGMNIHLYRFQEVLDETLGYHYGVVSMRPPFGDIRNEDGNLNRTVVSNCKNFGYEHVVLWDVSQTDFAKAKKAVKNGSILLYHARAKDVKCLEELIPWLVEEGYELVTVRELLEFDYIETSVELYVHQK